MALTYTTYFLCKTCGRRHRSENVIELVFQDILSENENAEWSQEGDHEYLCVGYSTCKSCYDSEDDDRDNV